MKLSAQCMVCVWTATAVPAARRSGKIKEVNTFSPGKHGHAKAHLVGLDIFTGKKYEETSQTSHSMEVPVVTKTEYPLMNLNADTGAVSLLQEPGRFVGKSFHISIHMGI